MNYFFVCEFEELFSPLRSVKLQGGGIHGNAILSPYLLKNGQGFRHSFQPFDWEKPNMFYFNYNQPRKGCRSFGCCEILTPQFGSILCYTTHFENFTSPWGRLKQFSEIMEHSHSQNIPLQIIGGDFNTGMQSLARFSWWHNDFSLSWKTLGLTEAEWWQQNFFEKKKDDQNNDNSESDFLFLKDKKEELRKYWKEFQDPFDKVNDITTIRLWGLYQSKLDWILVRGLKSISWKVEKGMKYSDHCWLYIDVVKKNDFEKEKENDHQQNQQKFFWKIFVFGLLVILIALLFSFLF